MTNANSCYAFFFFTDTEESETDNKKNCGMPATPVCSNDKRTSIALRSIDKIKQSGGEKRIEGKL